MIDQFINSYQTLGAKNKNQRIENQMKVSNQLKQVARDQLSDPSGSQYD